ncbi:unnamed protein product [Meloidogyne enterolobii]|uniref:Uncharacterized protein n=1 Tax=Meloidogyne enterolobii TaxID=390850 RepID=A0ACB1A3Y6_MELEN
MDRMSTDGETIFWRCDKRASTGCKGRIHTTAGEEREFKRLITEHSCSGVGDAARVRVQKVMSGIRQRGASTMEKPSQIRSAAVQNLPLAVLGIC